MGLISYSNIQDGTTADGADVNTPLNTIFNEFNGNIDSNNIKDNSIIASKIYDGAVSTIKIADGAITLAKIEDRVSTTTSTATLTPTKQVMVVTALAVNISIDTPVITGAVNGTTLLIRLKDNGTTRTITYAAIFRAIGVTLPTATTANKTVYIGFVYNATDNKWDAIAVGREA
jgi:hypothetical protein